MSKKTRSNKSQLDPRWAELSRVFEDRVDAYPKHVEWMWWLWCRITAIAKKLDRLLQRPSTLQPFTAKGRIAAVSFGDEALVMENTATEVAMTRALDAAETGLSSDSYDRIHTPAVSSFYARTVPVALALEGGQVVHFCDIDEGVGSTSGVRRDAYFLELVGRTLHAAGYVSEGAYTAMALRVEAASDPVRDAKYLWLGTTAPSTAPRTPSEAMGRRTRGFGELSCGLFAIYSVAGLTTVVTLLSMGRTDGTAQAGMTIAALVLPLLFVLPAAGRLIWPLLTLSARAVKPSRFKGPAPLAPLPVLMRTSRIGRPPMDRLRSYDRGRMTEWLAEALQWPQHPPYVLPHEWSLMEDCIWPWVALLLTLLLWAVAL